MQMNSSKSISIYLTSKDSECRLKNISEKEISVESNVELKTIRVNTHRPRQTILGFGGRKWRFGRPRGHREGV